MSNNDTTDKIFIKDVAAQVVDNTPDCTDANSTTLEVGWSTDKGKVRENNEDSLAAMTLNQANDETCQAVGVYVVADGMGGHAAGEVASKLAVRTAIQNLVDNATESSEDMPENYQEWLKSAVTVANRMVHRQASKDQKNMGTTLVMAVVAGHDVHVVNVGDSRAYLIGPDSIRQVTHDHSYVQMLVDAGTITPEQALKHPYRNVLTQSVGTEEDVAIDLFSETLGDNESLLLCSDGLWETLSNDRILQIVRAAATPSEACKALIDATNAAGGRDNIAAVLVRLGKDAHDAEASPAVEVDPDDTVQARRN